MLSVDDAEWWANYYKNAGASLIIRTKQMLDGSDKTRETMEKIIRATLKDYAKEFGVNLGEVRLT